MKKMFFVLALGMMAFHVRAQYSVTGKVTEPGGTPIVFANVVLENTFQGTFSGQDGEFAIKNVKKGSYSLIVSFIGYQTLVKELVVDKDVNLDFILQPSAILSDEVVVQASSLTAKTPVAYSSVSAEQIRKNNLGQDITYMISLTPSVIVSSDAGTGVGYTGFRIRGTDVKRTNVTVNGIPINDAESHDVFWVNMPDFVSSVQNINIQRGVGTSINGAGAFGATLNMQTNALHAKPYAEASSTVGSFRTFKNTLTAGTGLINNRFTFDVRLSKISSDGFIDRAFSDLKSFYVSGGYYSEGSALKLIVFSGKEITYQAWNGVPKVKLQNDSAGMRRYLDHWLISEDEYNQLVASDSRTYNLYTYRNEVDNYQQDHYQLLYSKEFSKNLYLNSAIHYTYGRGFYEGYKTGKDFSDFSLQPYILGTDTVLSSDFITQKWLNNDFYGANISLRYLKSRLDMVVGGSYTEYNGRHFGDIVWAQLVTYDSSFFRWYYSTGDKSDASAFLKANYQLNGVLNVYGDLQYRMIDYQIKGTDDDLREITQIHNYGFFNPKAGITFTPTENQRAFFSVAVAHKEPTRSDFTDADAGKAPKPEQLTDFEAGYDIAYSNWKAGINLFYMNYKDQLIMTGQINNVGAAVMVNVDKSFRRGIELEGACKIIKSLELAGNLTLSENKIIDFVDYVDDWDSGTQVVTEMGTTDISFSPNCVSGALIRWSLLKSMSIELQSKYVSRQFIDNSSNSDYSIDPYFVTDFMFSYTLPVKNIKGIKLMFKVNNLLNHEYETYAWLYRYRTGGAEYSMDGYFPQAGRNYMAGLVVNF